MKPFNIPIQNKGIAQVINKRIGIRRPVKFLFFKFKNRERIIAYTVLMRNTNGESEYQVFKTKSSGEWLKGALKNGTSINQENQRIISRAIKSAIDEFELKQGKDAYQELF